MALWLAICITLLASTGNSIGKALQKHGTKGLPKFSFESKVVWSYIHCTEWLVGIVADLLGGVLMLGAYALAPVRLCLCVCMMVVVGRCTGSQGVDPFGDATQQVCSTRITWCVHMVLSSGIYCTTSIWHGSCIPRCIFTFLFKGMPVCVLCTQA